MIEVSEVRQDHGVEWYEEGQLQQQGYCLVIVTYGKCVYWVNHEKLIMEKGDLLLLAEGVPFYGKSIPTVFHTKYKIKFQAREDAMKLSILQQPELFKHRMGCYDIVLERLKELLHQWKEKPSYYEMMSAALFTEVLIQISQELDRGMISTEKHRCAERMKYYIQQNYRDRVTKEELGNAIQRTPNYAAALFRQVTGQTISEYVHHHRIKTALYLLTESMLTISEIAEYVGYSDVSYFYRIFKRITGHSPSDYVHERSPIV
ncbi:helix-turn-helix transcriptional regulator [Paenibacillus sp. GCM10012307]|uniref:Helix-turn-helix transcriptional regulator n=1 Tax=Paenibacillus roseus TaxID=2798579 RepID=A0A934J095_9BACL|nr:AraC family transcriptional regulator [Paenibacillus roseus]MBJ6360944.1 helix-turn-helix transcriptional regulator [Paenibacillus roseus]